MMRAGGIVLFLFVLASPAFAQSLCSPIEVPKATVHKRDGKWAELAPAQWQFLRGIYALNPLTPPGLPFGDKAALATFPGDDGGVVFFIDGDQACTPMPVPRALLEMLEKVKSGEIPHEGRGL